MYHIHDPTLEIIMHTMDPGLGAFLLSWGSVDDAIRLSLSIRPSDNLRSSDHILLHHALSEAAQGRELHIPDHDVYPQVLSAATENSNVTLDETSRSNLGSSSADSNASGSGIDAPALNGIDSGPICLFNIFMQEVNRLVHSRLVMQGQGEVRTYV
ncbi:unnamed protein product [Protopolystoma xenopodis]|uniref:Uncharacterized protein n=1 Tax=Protopolystoma xenopodis TaxID=117903 RepID=A0A3S5CUT0_9PLAT|nr:unnamed protein product [Protopolystoma xenopodis]